MKVLKAMFFFGSLLIPLHGSCQTTPSFFSYEGSKRGDVAFYSNESKNALFGISFFCNNGQVVPGEIAFALLVKSSSNRDSDQRVPVMKPYDNDEDLKEYSGSTTLTMSVQGGKSLAREFAAYEATYGQQKQDAIVVRLNAEPAKGKTVKRITGSARGIAQAIITDLNSILGVTEINQLSIQYVAQSGMPIETRFDLQSMKMRLALQLNRVCGVK